MSSLELKFSMRESDVLGDGSPLAPGKCLLCQKVQPKSAKNEESENKLFWVCCECRQIDKTELLLGDDLKLRNICDILGDTRTERFTSDLNSQAAQLMWVELRHTVRCIYRKAGTELAIDHMLDLDKMKSLVHKLCEEGPQQLYHQLETQGREYVEEIKFHLLEHLLCHPSSIGIPQHAREFAQTLLDEYEQLLCATITLQSFLVELEDEHMARFGISWMLVNQHLFHQVVYSDPIIQRSLPGVCNQLKFGELQQSSNTTSKFESYSSVYYRLKAFEEEMVKIEQHWIKAIVSLASFVNSENLANSDISFDDWELLGRQYLARKSLAKEDPISVDEAVPASLKGKFLFPPPTKGEESDPEDAAHNLPSSLLGHKKLFIKHSIPAPPIYPKTQRKAAAEVLKNVKVDKISSGSIEIKASRMDEESSGLSRGSCDCTACSTLMDSLAGELTEEETSEREEETSPLEHKNWVKILHDIKDVGCDSSTQTIDDSEDRPSSERRLSTSSISSKDSDKPKYCACCYCELVGHPNPGSHSSHNYELFREKLRRKLEDRRRELCPEHQSGFSSFALESGEGSKAGVDDRSVEELVSYIEGKEAKETKRRKRKSKPKEKAEGGCVEKETKHRHASAESPPKSEAKAEGSRREGEVEEGPRRGEEEEGEPSFAFHLDKYESLSKEQRSLLLCGSRLDDHPMYRKQNQLVESMKLPREMTDRSNRNNIPNGRPKPNFPFLKTIDKEGNLSSKPSDKTDVEKSREAAIAETLRRERTKPEPAPRPKINIHEEYKALSKQSAALLAASRPKQIDHSKTPYGPPPPPPPLPFAAKPTRAPKVEPAQLKKQPVSQKEVTSAPPPKQPLKATKSEPVLAPKRPAEQKPLQKYDVKCKDEDCSSKKKKFKKKKKRNESLDDIFLPKCEVDEMDYLEESERELEAFKRFCMESQPLKTRQKVQLNWKNVNIKKPN